MHPQTPEQCRATRQTAAAPADDSGIRAHLRRPAHGAACTTRNRKRPDDAKACIDQFEFPDIPCAYPVVWVQRARSGRDLRGDGQAPV